MYSVKNAKVILRINFVSRVPACDADELMSGLDRKVIAEMCFGFLINLLMALTVHAIQLMCSLSYVKLR